VQRVVLCLKIIFSQHIEIVIAQRSEVWSRRSVGAVRYELSSTWHHPGNGSCFKCLLQLLLLQVYILMTLVTYLAQKYWTSINAYIGLLVSCIQRSKKRLQFVHSQK